LNEPLIAVPLYELFHMRSGQPHVRTRAELAQRVRIPETATVIASGVGYEIYRFGANELVGAGTQALIARFFDRLFHLHGVGSAAIGETPLE
jgi:hypothetical protein